MSTPGRLAGRTPWYGVPVTVRHALLPIGAVLVLALGVYLFVSVRAMSSPEPGDPPRPPRSSPPVEARVQPPAAGPNAAATAPQRPARTEVPPSPRGLPPAPLEPAPSGAKLDADMDEANKAYDRGDYDDAKQVAGRVLAQQPTNVRMLRIMVSASCIDGDSTVAQSYYARLPPPDQEQMRTRCARYGVSFGDK